MNYNLEIPCDVQYILDVLYKNGYEGYMVGGCVRDLILGEKPNDYDIATNAEPDTVARLFQKVILTGLKHGTVTVVINNNQYEVTTYRMDGDYEDSRHPENVCFVNDIREDLSRRDFTINAMAYNHKNGLVDCFEGIADLNKKIIRTVGDPKKRFKEDALRMLRAVRFAVQLKFEIEEPVLESIITLSKTIENISKERIKEEFNKIIIKDPRGIELLHKCRLLEYILNDLNIVYNLYDNNELADHLINSCCNIENKLYLRLAMLFHDLGRFYADKEYEEKNICNNEYCLKSAQLAEKILRNLKYDKVTINKVKILILHHQDILTSRFSIKKLLNSIGADLFEDLIKVKRADIYALNYSDEKQKIDEINIIEKKYNQIISEKECFNLKALNINGEDLINIGVNKGKDIGIMLNYLLDEVMKNNSMNLKERLIAMACQKLNENK